jgi:hypothetical protein
MPVMSPKVGEILVKTTHSKDLDEALHKIISEYLELKLNTLQEILFVTHRKEPPQIDFSNINYYLAILQYS